MVDEKIDWAKHVSTLRSRGITGDELRKRVGYCIAINSQQKLDIHRKIGVLLSGDKWSSYNEELWNEYLDDIENKIKDINALHLQLLHIPYIPPNKITLEANTLGIYNWIIKSYHLSPAETKIIVSLYGESLLSQFCRNNGNVNVSGKFPFLIKLKEWYDKKSLNPVKVKEFESKNLQKYFG